MENHLLEALSSHGYQPHGNPYGVGGQMFGAKGSGVMIPQGLAEIMLEGEMLSVVKASLVGEPYKAGAHYVLEALAEFASVEALVEWLAVHGKASGPGLAAWEQGNWN